MSRLLRPALMVLGVIAAIWAVALPTSDLPNASGDIRLLYQKNASQELGVRGYLTNRYTPLASPTTPSTDESIERLGEPPYAQSPASSDPSSQREQFLGLATWYGAPFHGSRMRNGEVFNMYDETTTAANKWPLGSTLRVTNTNNGEAIEVVVRDTGGFRPPLLVDLSYAAFGLLDSHSRGVIPVTVEVILEGG